MPGPFDIYLSYRRWLVNLKLDYGKLDRIAAFVQALNIESLAPEIKQETVYFNRCTGLLKKHITRMEADIRFFNKKVSARIRSTNNIERPRDEHLIQHQLKQRYFFIRKETGIVHVRFSRLKKKLV